MNDRARGMIEMIGAMTISGTIGWFVVKSGLPVTDVVFWRCAFGAATLLVVCAALGLLRGALSPRFLALAALGGVAIVVNWLLLFAAYSHASIAIATAVYNTQQFMLVALGAVFFAERLTIAKFAWLTLAFVGVLLIVQAKPNAAAYAGGASYAAGIALSLGAAFFYAVAAIIAKKLNGHPPHLVALIQTCVGIVLLAPFATFSPLPQGAGTWTLLITVGVIHTGVMFVVLYGAIQKLPTHLTGSLSFIYPIVAAIVDVAAFGLRLQPAQILGIGAILIAAAGMTLGWSFARTKPRIAVS